MQTLLTTFHIKNRFPLRILYGTPKENGFYKPLRKNKTYLRPPWLLPLPEPEEFLLLLPDEEDELRVAELLREVLLVLLLTEEGRLALLLREVPPLFSFTEVEGLAVLVREVPLVEEGRAEELPDEDEEGRLLLPVLPVPVRTDVPDELDGRVLLERPVSYTSSFLLDEEGRLVLDEGRLGVVAGRAVLVEGRTGEVVGREELDGRVVTPKSSRRLFI